MSYARMQKAEQELASEVDAWFKKADALDTQEDAEFGPDQRGDELPAWVVNKQQRLAKIRAAKQALEAEAKEALEAAKREDPPPSDSEKPRRGRPRKPPTGVPKPEAQRNFSDPESRIMNTREGFQQCYNAQAAVDADSQVIVACDVTQSASDRNQLKPMVEQIEAHNGRNPDRTVRGCWLLLGRESRRVGTARDSGLRRHWQATARKTGASRYSQ